MDHVQNIGDSDIAVQSRGIVAQMTTVNFVANLVIFHKLLSLTNGLNEALQSPSLNIAQSNILIVGLIETLSNLRNYGWPGLWKDIQKMCNDNDISSLLQCSSHKRKCKPTRSHDIIIDSITGQRSYTHDESCDSLCLDLFLPVLDRIVQEMNSRFSSQSLAITHSVEALLNTRSESFLDFSIVTPIVDMYGTQLRIDRPLLKAELTVASGMWKNHRETSDMNNKGLADNNNVSAVTDQDSVSKFVEMYASGFDTTSNIINL